MADPPAVEIVNADGASPFVLTCEHASSYIPQSYVNLGLPEHDLQRHIAWDIGAANVARRLSALIDAPLFLSGYSRLLIDCNRPLGSETAIPVISETTPIPGNIGLSAEAAETRAKQFYWPFQNAVAAHLDRRRERRQRAMVIGIHSFTPVFKGVARPWAAGILFRKAARLGQGLVEVLSDGMTDVAANEPYTIEDDSDYTVPVHGENRGLDAVLIEIRQDLICNDDGAEQWSRRLERALMFMT